MRISDWSSDVCSSDLKISSGTEKIDSTGGLKASSATTKSTTDHSLLRRGRFMPPRSRRRQAEQGARPPDQIAGREGFRHVEIGRASCRERVLSVSVDLGGRRIIKKTKERDEST